LAGGLGVPNGGPWGFRGPSKKGPFKGPIRREVKRTPLWYLGGEFFPKGKGSPPKETPFGGNSPPGRIFSRKEAKPLGCERFLRSAPNSGGPL